MSKPKKKQETTRSSSVNHRPTQKCIPVEGDSNRTKSFAKNIFGLDRTSGTIRKQFTLHRLNWNPPNLWSDDWWSGESSMIINNHMFFKTHFGAMANRERHKCASMRNCTPPVEKWMQFIADFLCRNFGCFVCCAYMCNKVAPTEVTLRWMPMIPDGKSRQTGERMARRHEHCRMAKGSCWMWLGDEHR